MDDPAAIAGIERTLRVIGAIKRLRHARLGVVGGRPTGFYGSTYDELRLRKTLGIEIIPIEVSEVLAAYDKVPESKANETVERVKSLGQQVSADKEDIRRVGRLYTALHQFTDSDNLSGIAVKCWPELKDRLLTLA